MPDSPVVVRRRSRRARSGYDSDGYMAVDDECRRESGVRGCRGCCLCMVVTLLLLLAIANALVTAGLLYFLSITHEGMTSLELFTGEKAAHVLSDITFESLVLHDGLSGATSRNIHFSGEEVLAGASGSQFHIDGNEMLIKGEKFDLVTSEGRSLFSTSSDLSHDLYQIKNLHAAAIDVGAVTSRENYPDLHIESSYSADIVGTEGVEVVSAGHVELDAALEILVGTQAGKVTLDSKEGVYLSTGLPQEGKQPNSSNNGVQLKLCVCGRTGRLFAVKYAAPHGGCDRISRDNHPCDSS